MDATTSPCRLIYRIHIPYASCQGIRSWIKNVSNIRLHIKCAICIRWQVSLWAGSTLANIRCTLLLIRIRPQRWKRSPICAYIAQIINNNVSSASKNQNLASFNTGIVKKTNWSVIVGIIKLNSDGTRERWFFKLLAAFKQWVIEN